MMTYLLDTNAVRDLTDNNPNVRRRLSNLQSSDRTVVCSIVLGEVLFGIERRAHGRRRSELSFRTARILDGLPCEPITPEAAAYYAVIKADLERQGRMKGENDMWIAATALALGAVLVTRDRGFDDMVIGVGLRVEDWTA